MVFFLILSPFAAFAALMMVASVPMSLFSAAAIAFAVVMYDAIRGRSLKMLHVGSALVFVAIGGYVTLVDGHVSATAVRMAVDIGVLAIALISLAIRMPFTLQYAREAVDAETALRPAFLQTNYILTFAWTGAFVLMLVADMLMIYAPSLPLWFGVGIAFAARNSAVYFTRWYPQHRRAKLAPEATAN